MPFNPDSHLRSEVASEPASWRAVVARLPEFGDAIPERGARVAVVGCGTSFYMAQSTLRCASSQARGRPTRSRRASTATVVSTTTWC